MELNSSHPDIAVHKDFDASLNQSFWFTNTQFCIVQPQARLCLFKVCRPTEVTYFKEIVRPHSEEVWRLLDKFDLAEVSLGHQSVFRAIIEPSIGSFKYDADCTELFSPVNAKFLQWSVKQDLFALWQLCYLVKSVAGVEESATVFKDGASKHTIRVSKKIFI